jgi:hypothetical protein
MATIEDLILSIEVEQEQTTKKRDRALAEVQSILARAKADGRPKLTPEEDADCDAAVNRRNQAKADLIGIKEKMRRAKEAQDAEREIEAALQERSVDPKTTAGAKPAYDRVARVGSEERTYHPGNCRRGREFLMDVVRNFLYQDPSAQTRLARHLSEERVERGQYMERATGTGAFAGLTVPQYLTEMFAPAVAARRPFADSMTPLPLPPSGMTVNISRITTPTAVGNQANENDAVTEQDADDTLLTENVQTAAGQQTVSRQAIDRGTGIEEITMRDLQRRYATNLDSTIVNQATTGLLAVATDITWTEAAPTGSKFYPKILEGAAASEAALLGQADPDVVVMHSRRWYWLQSQMVSTWPLIGQPGIDPRHGGENLVETYGSGFRGTLPSGMRVIVDNNIPTNIGSTQDTVAVVPRDESFLWEDPDAPQFIRAEQAKAANLGVLLVLYGYYAYTMRRYANSHQQIVGSGLTTPTFVGT